MKKNIIFILLALVAAPIFVAVMFHISNARMHESTRRREREFKWAIHSSTWRQVASFMQAYDELQEENESKYWASGFAQYLVERCGIFYFEKPDDKKNNSQQACLYLLDREQAKGNIPVLVGYSDTIRLSGRDGFGFLFFLRNNEVVSVQVDERQLRKIGGENAYEKRRASLYYDYEP